MDDHGYFGDGNRFAKIISNNIYSQVGSMVELVANYYDEDATQVKIDFTEVEDESGNVYINEIRITGDGNGFTIDKLNGLREIGNSEKRESRYSEKFKRVKLGSFGIAFTSFQILGNELEIYSKNSGSQMLYMEIQINNTSTLFSEVKELDCCDIIEFNTGCKFVIKNCKIPKSLFFNNDKNALYYDLLRNKLSYLPIGNNFKIRLCGNEISRFLIADDSYKLNFDFNIDDIKFNGEIYYSATKIENIHYRGVFLQIDGRIIDWNIFNDIRQGITSPGSVEYRICGYIMANGLRDKINASRNGVTEGYLSSTISNILKRHISNINKKAKKYYGWETKSTKITKSKLKQEITNTDTKTIQLNNNFENVDNVTNTSVIEFKESYNNELERKERVKKRIRTQNKDLERLGIKFCYDAETEIEVIIIASQMCQNKLLDFDIMDSTSTGTDSIILKNGELYLLEFEKSLSNFFMHNHNHNGIDYILCWDVNEKDLKKQSESYVKRYSGYINSIKYSKPTGECKFINCDGTQHTIKLYIISDMIRKLQV